MQEEVAKAIGNLPDDALFDVIAYQQSRSVEFGTERLEHASITVKRLAKSFVARLSARAEGDPLPAIKLAMRESPDIIWIVCSKEFPDNDAVATAFSGYHGKLNAALL